MLWAIFAALGVLFVGNFDVQETPVAVAVGLLAAAMTLAAARAGGLRYRVRIGWLAVVPRVLGGIVRDTVTVFGALVRYVAGGAPPASGIVRVPFDPGGDDPESLARRALAIAAVSATPNSLALDVDREGGAIVLHRLNVDVPPPSSREWPV